MESLSAVDGGLKSGLQYHVQKPVLKKGHLSTINLFFSGFLNHQQQLVCDSETTMYNQCLQGESRNRFTMVSHTCLNSEGGSVAQCQLPKRYGELIGSLA